MSKLGWAGPFCAGAGEDVLPAGQATRAKEGTVHLFRSRSSAALLVWNKVTEPSRIYSTLGKEVPFFDSSPDKHSQFSGFDPPVAPSVAVTVSSQETWAAPWKGTKLLEEIQNGSTKMPCSVPWRKRSYHERYTVKCLPSIDSPHFTHPQAYEGGTNTISIFWKRTLRFKMKLTKLCLRWHAK